MIVECDFCGGFYCKSIFANSKTLCDSCNRTISLIKKRNKYYNLPSEYKNKLNLEKKKNRIIKKKHYSEYKKKYYLEHKDKINKRNKEDYWKNKEKYNLNKKTYYLENKDKLLKKSSTYQKSSNWKKRRANIHSSKYSKNFHYKLSMVLRCRVRKAIKNQCTSKAQSTIDLIGCSIEDCRIHLEKQFVEGMTWENHGTWHIDHKIPCASFNLEDPEEQKRCFHYTNLQPLWAEDNLRKGDKVVEHGKRFADKHLELMRRLSEQ